MIKYTIVIVSGERPERFSMRWLLARRLLCYFSMTCKSASHRQSQKWGVEMPMTTRIKRIEQETGKKNIRNTLLCNTSLIAPDGQTAEHMRHLFSLNPIHLYPSIFLPLPIIPSIHIILIFPPWFLCALCQCWGLYFSKYTVELRRCTTCIWAAWMYESVG